MLIVELAYHEQTDSYWTNYSEWKTFWKENSISYGSVEIDSDNLFEVKTIMNKQNYVMVRDLSGTPFKSKYAKK